MSDREANDATNSHPDEQPEISGTGLAGASEGEKEVLEKYLLQFLNLEKRFPLLPGIDNTGAMAGLFGLEESELAKLRDRYRQNARDAAVELLEEGEVNEWLDDLPFGASDTIVALGDSMTDDLQGWFEIFKNVLEITVPGADFTFVNGGVSYNTSTEAVQRLNRDVLDQDPDWVLVALGTFDMQRLHVAPNRTLVPLADYWENLNTIETVVEEVTDNPIIWISPPPVITEMLQQIRLFDFDLFEEDLQQAREVLNGKKGYIVDPAGRRMGEDTEPDAWNYLSDGLHPSLSGHVETVREVLRHLTQAKDPEEGSSLEPPEDYEG
ncbi:MAG: SGNH/GDSL hydrolase family protein [Balneolaceae bacterium]|nr:SGNH/GDSL hydrolase family protein [Balneolaceae bacterium]